MPALPTGNLTFHANASVDADLWQVNTAGAFTVHPTDGQVINYWDDVEHADIEGVLGTAPVWRSTTPLMLLPCVDFNGSTQYYRLRNNTNTTDTSITSVISVSAFTILVSVYVEGIGTNAAAAYDNDGLIADSGAFFGIHFKDSGAPKALFYTWDGNEDTISLSIALNTSYVLMFRHESGNIYASINGGTESSVASGNTSVAAESVDLGRGSGAGPPYFNGRLGEIAVYNVALTGTNLTNAISYFTDKWLVPVVPKTVAFISNKLRPRIFAPGLAR